MQIINVIEIKKGVLDNVESFVIQEQQLSQEIVKQAEALFLKKAKENGWKSTISIENYTEDDDYPHDYINDTENEQSDLIAEANWDNENGYEVLITWSNVNV